MKCGNFAFFWNHYNLTILLLPQSTKSKIASDNDKIFQVSSQHRASSSVPRLFYNKDISSPFWKQLLIPLFLTHNESYRENYANNSNVCENYNK